MLVTERYQLPTEIKERLTQTPTPWGFGGFSEAVYYRTYSRQKPDGSQEQWADTIIRVVEGVISIRKDWYRKVGVPWDAEYWDYIAAEMADAMFHMRFLPPGRGLWAMGSEYVYERGAAALSNCGFVDVNGSLADAAGWAMDMLMCGVGVGFSTDTPRDINVKDPEVQGLYTIPDSREGWVEAVRRVLAAPDRDGLVFNSRLIRPAGSPIRGFGGTASGAEPLINLLCRLHHYLDEYEAGNIDKTRLIADVFNAIGACVVAGNVRRSAELACGSIHDETFLNLKNYQRYPERVEIGGMSNNSVVLQTPDDFLLLPTIADRIRDNGEPGIINLMNVQKYGRFKEKKPDHAVGVNPCVPGETRILTRHGYERIADLVDTPVEVWNGKEWSLTTPRITGENQPLVRISLSDGTALTTTPAHRFHISDSYRASKPSIVPASALKPGDRLWKYDMPVVELGEEVAEEDAYTQGVYAGDGFLHEGKSFIWLYGAKQGLMSHLTTRYTKGDDPRNRSLVALKPETQPKTFVPHHWGLNARLAWLAGLLDTDGCLTKDGSLQITSVEHQFLLETRLMLTTLGVQAKVTPAHPAGERMLPDGRGGLKSYHCRQTSRLLISSADSVRLRELVIGKYLRRIDLSGIKPQRDARRFVQVLRVEDAGVAEQVYCFTEPLNHSGTFEGVVTGQCAEITLESYELCNLCEVFPTRCKTEDQFLWSLALATMYASTVALLPTHSETTNRVVARNRRIGVSVSGIADWLDSSSISHLTKLLRQGYEDVVVPCNQALAKQAGVPASVRVTTVKPSGTISQLAGVSPGMHWPIHRHYIRRMRVGKNSPIAPILSQSGIPFEEDAYSADTWVFEFPQAAGRGKTRSVSDVSIWEQAAMVAFLQREWADNAVSNTLTFNPKSEGRDIEKVIAMFAPQIKSMSLLPGSDNIYPQMPYERITESEYKERRAKLREIDWSEFTDSDGQDSRFCQNDGCEI